MKLLSSEDLCSSNKRAKQLLLGCTQYCHEKRAAAAVGNWVALGFGTYCKRARSEACAVVAAACCPMQAMDLKGHNSQVMAAAFNHDGTKAVTASKDGTLRFWNTNVRYYLQVSPAAIGTSIIYITRFA